MANNFIKYLVYTPDYVLEKDDVKLLDTTSKEELVKTIFKRDGKKIIKNLLSKKREKPSIDYRGVYIHPELSIVGIARVPEGGVLEDYEKYIHLLNEDLANYVINNIINILDGNVTDENGLNLVINKKVEEIIARKLPAIFTYKGSIDKVTSLPKDNNKVGDTYNVTSTGANYTWDGSKWDKLSETIDLSNLATKKEVKILINEVKNEIPEYKEYYLVKEEYKFKVVPHASVNDLKLPFSKFISEKTPKRDYLTTDLNELLPLTFNMEENERIQYDGQGTLLGKWGINPTPVRTSNNISKNTINIIYTYLIEFTPENIKTIPITIEYVGTIIEGVPYNGSFKFTKKTEELLPKSDAIPIGWKRKSDGKIFKTGDIVTNITKPDIFDVAYEEISNDFLYDYEVKIQHTVGKTTTVKLPLKEYFEGFSSRRVFMKNIDCGKSTCIAKFNNNTKEIDCKFIIEDDIPYLQITILPEFTQIRDTQIYRLEAEINLSKNTSRPFEASVEDRILINVK